MIICCFVSGNEALEVGSWRFRRLSDSAEIAWTPPIDDSVSIRGYILRYGTGSSDMQEVQLDSSQRFYTVGNLRM